jgi:hypothetical protein
MSASTDSVTRSACQRLLAASSDLVRCSSGATLTAAVLLWLWARGLAPRLPLAAGLLFGSLAAGLAALYYGFRVRLDADLFALLEAPGPVTEGDFAAGIDTFRACLVGSADPPGPLGGRYAGALRLWRRLAAALGLQVALLLGATGAACLAALAGS